jgi:predicted HTH transcriptional regulator
VLCRSLKSQSDESIDLVADIVPSVARSVTHEVLVTVVAHTDYSLTGMHIRVAIYADRLEVENHGRNWAQH